MLTNQQRQWLSRKTRRVDFLWKLGFAILGVGLAIGIAVDAAVPAWINQPEGEEQAAPPEGVPDSRWETIESHAERGEWGAVARAIPGVLFQRWKQLGASTLAVLTGLSWLAFLLQAIQFRQSSRLRLGASLTAMLLGVVSIGILIFFLLWQEHRWGLARSEQLVPGLRFYVFGVGLREELAKFLCVLPLLPWLVRRRDELAALVVSGCVGLGFAMEENIGYFARSAGSNTLGRLLSAAPAHIALTGLVGLAAYRACRWPKEWGVQFFAVFGAAVIVHGLYDAFISLPDLADYSMASWILFCLLQWQFFRELRDLRDARRETLSLTANFIACVALVAAATFIYLAAAAGWKTSLDIMFRACLAQAVMVYLFLREMPEKLTTV